MELGPSCLFLQFRIFEGSLLRKFLELLPYFFIFSLNVLEITLPGIEIVLVLPAVVTSVVFLDYFGLLIKELALLFLHF